MGMSAVNTDKSETKLKNDIEEIFTESVGAVDRLETEYEDKTLRRLNRNTITLVCYEKSFTAAPKHGREIKEKVEEKIKSDTVRCEQLTTESQEILKGCDEQLKKLKDEEK